MRRLRSEIGCSEKDCVEVTFETCLVDHGSLLEDTEKAAVSQTEEVLMSRGLHSSGRRQKSIFKPGVGGGEDDREPEIPPTPQVRRKLLWPLPLPLSSLFLGEQRVGGGSAIILTIKIIVVTMHRTFTMHPWGITAG